MIKQFIKDELLNNYPKNGQKTNWSIVSYKNFVFFFIDRYNIRFFPEPWKYSFLKRVNENECYREEMDRPKVLIILIDKLFQPWDLFGINFLTIQVMSPSFMVTFSVNLFPLVFNGVKQLKFVTEIFCETKSFKKFCFFLWKSKFILQIK